MKNKDNVITIIVIDSICDILELYSYLWNVLIWAFASRLQIEIGPSID